MHGEIFQTCLKNLGSGDNGRNFSTVSRESVLRHANEDHARSVVEAFARGVIAPGTARQATPGRLCNKPLHNWAAAAARFAWS